MKKTIGMVVLACLILTACRNKSDFIETTLDLNMQMVYVDGGTFMMGTAEEHGVL